MRRWHGPCSLLLLVVLSACGGGGGGGGETGPATFHYASMSASVSPHDFRRSIGTAVLSGDGSLVAELDTFVFGLASTPSTQTADFAVATDGSATLGVGGTTLLRGFRSDNREVVIMGSDGATGADPALVVLIKRATDVSAADLEDVFITSRLEYKAVPRDWLCGTHGRTFGVDAPNVLIPSVRNQNEIVSVDLFPPLRLDDYEAPGGDISYLSPSDRMRGAMTSDREFLWVGGTGARSQPVTAWTGAEAMVRISSSASAATFSGRYGFVGMTRTAFGFEVLRGVLVADGAGSAEVLDWRSNAEGRATERLTLPTLVTAVNRRGELTVDVFPTLTLQGGISSSGRYAVLAGGTVTGAWPTVWILVRLTGP